jgi:DNA-binding MarR family transcriptional regulator
MVPDEEGSYVFSLLGRSSFLVEALQQESLAEFELSFVDYSALRVLDRAGEPYQLSPSRMAELLVRTTGGMTKIVDRLERRGLVERIRADGDRRSVLVALTALGLVTGRRAREAYHERRRQVLTGITEEELAQIQASLDVLVAAMDRDRARYAAAGDAAT